jgi:carboxypeptidase Taq
VKESNKEAPDKLNTVKDLFYKIKSLDSLNKSIDILTTEPVYNSLDEIDKGCLDEFVDTDDSPENKSEVKIPSDAYSKWVQAKETNNYNDFAPVLEKIFEYNRGYETDNPYNVLINKKCPGMTTEKLDFIFDKLKQETVPLLKQINNKVEKNPELHQFEFLDIPLDKDKIEKFTNQVVKDMGFDFSRGRLGKTVHPITLPIAKPYDVGITSSKLKDNPTLKDFLILLYGKMHEAGHGIVFQGVDESLTNTPVKRIDSNSNESQSRLWENIIGKSRPFWKHYFPKLQKAFPELKDVKLDDFYKAINMVQPSTIRVDADEATYNSHIMLRYEIEKDLINDKEGNLEEKVAKLPETWNQKMQEYVGITPKNDSEGVLQDDHWADNWVGHFPAYLLGNIASAQFYNKAKEEIPDLEKQIENGNFKPLKEWLTEKIYKKGGLNPPLDILVEQVTGKPMDSHHFAKYLNDKYSEIYNLEEKNNVLSISEARSKLKPNPFQEKAS